MSRITSIFSVLKSTLSTIYFVTLIMLYWHFLKITLYQETKKKRTAKIVLASKTIDNSEEVIVKLLLFNQSIFAIISQVGVEVSDQDSVEVSD